MDKKNLYNKIMHSVSKEVKKVLNEAENINTHIKKYIYILMIMNMIRNFLILIKN